MAKFRACTSRFTIQRLAYIIWQPSWNFATILDFFSVGTSTNFFVFFLKYMCAKFHACNPKCTILPLTALLIGLPPSPEYANKRRSSATKNVSEMSHYLFFNGFWKKTANTILRNQYWRPMIILKYRSRRIWWPFQFQWNFPPFSKHANEQVNQ